MENPALFVLADPTAGRWGGQGSSAHSEDEETTWRGWLEGLALSLSLLSSLPSPLPSPLLSLSQPPPQPPAQLPQPLPSPWISRLHHLASCKDRPAGRGAGSWAFWSSSLEA